MTRRPAGATAPLTRMLPIALLAMIGMVLPSVAGWGPREGVTAWSFGAAGLGVQQGVTTAVVYGVIDRLFPMYPKLDISSIGSGGARVITTRENGWSYL